MKHSLLFQDILYKNFQNWRFYLFAQVH